MKLHPRGKLDDKLHHSSQRHPVLALSSFCTVNTVTPSFSWLHCSLKNEKILLRYKVSSCFIAPVIIQELCKIFKWSVRGNFSSFSSDTGVDTAMDRLLQNTVKLNSFEGRKNLSQYSQSQLFESIFENLSCQDNLTVLQFDYIPFVQSDCTPPATERGNPLQVQSS